MRQRPAIDLVAGHRVEGIHNRHQTRAQRKLLASLLVRLATAIEPGARELHDVKYRRRCTTRPENVRSYLPMSFDDVVLVGRQGRGLEEDRIGHADLADVVQQSCYL